MAPKDEKGTALVELALAIPILLLLIFGVVEVGLAIYQKNTMSLAAREGARVAAITPLDTLNLGSDGQAATRARELFSDEDQGKVTIVTTRDGRNVITVTITRPFEYEGVKKVADVLHISVPDITLSATASMRSEY